MDSTHLTLTIEYQSLGGIWHSNRDRVHNLLCLGISIFYVSVNRSSSWLIRNKLISIYHTLRCGTAALIFCRRKPTERFIFRSKIKYVFYDPLSRTSAPLRRRTANQPKLRCIGHEPCDIRKNHYVAVPTVKPIALCRACVRAYNSDAYCFSAEKTQSVYTLHSHVQ